MKKVEKMGEFSQSQDSCNENPVQFIPGLLHIDNPLLTQLHDLRIHEDDKKLS